MKNDLKKLFSTLTEEELAANLLASGTLPEGSNPPTTKKALLEALVAAFADVTEPLGLIILDEDTASIQHLSAAGFETGMHLVHLFTASEEDVGGAKSDDVEEVVVVPVASLGTLGVEAKKILSVNEVSFEGHTYVDVALEGGTKTRLTPEQFALVHNK